MNNRVEVLRQLGSDRFFFWLLTDDKNNQIVLDNDGLRDLYYQLMYYIDPVEWESTRVLLNDHN